MSRHRVGMRPIHVVVPGPIDTLTGGFIYDRKIANVLSGSGRLGTLLCLDGWFPDPDSQDLEIARQRVNALPRAGPVVIDGLALTALAETPERLPARQRLIALVHHPLADENGPIGAPAQHLFQAERQALTCVAGVIVTSTATARRLGDFGVAPDRIRVAPPGLDMPTKVTCHTSRADIALRLLCAGSLTPRKAQDILLSALSDLSDIDWRLDLVGAPRDPEFAAMLRAMAHQPSLAGRVTFRGAFPDTAMSAHYAAADLFVLPSRHEGFGMALAEAMAHGLPIVSCRAGAIPDTVPEAAGLLVPPGDAAALATALRLCMTDRERRIRYGLAARRVAGQLLSWNAAGCKFLAAVDALTGTT